VINFKEWYLKKLANDYKADITDLTIHKLTEGSIIVHVSMDIGNPLIENPSFPAR